MKKAMIMLLGVAFGLCASLAGAHPVAWMHEEDMEGVFTRIKGGQFHKTVDKISRSIDNDLPKSFEERFGKIPGGRVGNHRIIGHGWTLDGEIPKDVLKELESSCPGRKGEILKWWSEKAAEYSKWMEEATGLPPKQAKALAGLHWDLHLLGDRTPDNTLVNRVLRVKEIEKNIEKNCSVLFKGRPEYAKGVEKSLRAALKAGGTEAEQAARLMKVLQKEVPFSEMLSRSWGRVLGKNGIEIVPRTAKSVRVESFLTKLRVSLPKTQASKIRANSAKGRATAATGGKQTATSIGKSSARATRASARAIGAFAVALPVVVETGFFFYDEKKNREAFERGEQTYEETQCVTYENIGKHGAALALGAAVAWGGAEVGMAIGAGGGPVGAGVGAVVGAVVGGIAGGIAGEFGGEWAGEKVYVEKAEQNAEKGDLAAAFFLGGYHYKRIDPDEVQAGKDEHVQEALRYLAQATTNGGFAKANVFLGEMAWNGIGQDENKEKSIELWREAVELGDVDGMYLLARAMLAGEGVEQDIEGGFSLMYTAAARGCELAIEDYPETYEKYMDWMNAQRKEKRMGRVRIFGFGVAIIGVLVGVVAILRKRRVA